MLLLYLGRKALMPIAHLMDLVNLEIARNMLSALPLRLPELPYRGIE